MLCLSGLQWSVPWLPGDRADGFPLQKKQRAETWDVSCVSLIYCSITHIRHSQIAPQQDTRSKIRDLVVFVEEGTALPLLAASGVALAQHCCSNATSSVCCPHISWAALGICFSCSLLITCLEAAASTSKRSKNYSVCSKWTCRSWCSFALNLPPTCPQLVLKRHILHCCVGPAVQTLQMLQSFFGVSCLNLDLTFFLLSTQYLYFSTSESNGISSLRLPEIFLVDRSSQRKESVSSNGCLPAFHTCHLKN